MEHLEVLLMHASFANITLRQWNDMSEPDFRALPWGELTPTDFNTLMADAAIPFEKKKIAKDIKNPPRARVQRHASPNFTIGDFANVAGIPSDELFFLPSDPGGDLLARVDFLPEWWFLYFWKEAKTTIGNEASLAEKNEFLIFFNATFKKGPTWSTNNQVVPRGRFLNPPNAPGDPWTANLLTSGQLLAILNMLLKYGFKCITLAGGQVVPNDTSADLVALCESLDVKVHWKAGWRAESWRDIQRLRRTGYLAQASDDQAQSANEQSWAVKCNLRQNWHPYTDPAVRNRLYYRKNQNDNCLYSAVSLAHNWKTAACFPKIAQHTEYPKLAGVNIDAKARSAHPKYIGIVTFRKAEPGDSMTDCVRMMFVTTSKISLMVVEGIVFRTDNAQQRYKNGECFPEFAVPKVEGRNVMAMVQLLRVHHGPTDADGFTALIDNRFKQPPETIQLVEAFKDFRAFSVFKDWADQQYGSVANECPASLMWTDTGFAAAAIPLLDGKGRRRTGAEIESILLDGRCVYGTSRF
jgi:hypothetical protein